MIDRLLTHPYDLPLARTWRSSKDAFERRQGLLVEIRSEGLSGFGDCAPLPGAGTETLDQAHRALSGIQSRLKGMAPEDLMDARGGDLDAVPAARFAVECAVLDLLSRRAQVSLRRRLWPKAKDRVPVNVMAGPLSELTLAGAHAYYGQGYRVLKVKVGLETPENELERLDGLIAELPPDLGLRLDANGAWELEDAKRMLDALAERPIESLEEPLRDPTPERLAELQSSIPFPLARDESLQGLGADIDPETLGVRRLVLKPAVIGGLTRTLDLARAAMAAGMEIVVTSLVETSAGLWPTAQLAAATGSSAPHGLATADWLSQDLGEAPTPKDGFIQLPLSAGSGFCPFQPSETNG